jgi:hypothetical protein
MEKYGFEIYVFGKFSMLIYTHFDVTCDLQSFGFEMEI